MGVSSKGPGGLQQKACSLVGMASCLLQTRGNFAVVVHGPADCCTVFPRHVLSFPPLRTEDPNFSSENFFCTMVSEMDVAAGRTAQKLSDCIEAVGRFLCPEIIFVLGTCLSTVIGDDIKGLAGKGQRGRGPLIVPVATSGLRLEAQPRVVDFFERLMVETTLARWKGAVLRRGGGRSGVALAGLSLVGEELDELRNVLKGAGLNLRAAIMEFSSLEDWRALCSAGTVGVVDLDAHRSMIEALEKGAGVRCLEMPAPFGISRTMEFYRCLLGGVGREDVVEAVLGDAKLRALEAVEEARRALSGKRVAYEVGSLLGFRAGMHAMEGLAHVEVFLELGMKVVLLVQGPDSAESRSEIERVKKRLGLDLPYVIFQDPGKLVEVFSKGGYDLIYCSDGRRQQAMESRTPMLPLGSMRPLFVGMRRNAQFVSCAVHSLFLRRYGVYL